MPGDTGSSDAGADLDATMVAEDEGGAPTSKDAGAPATCNAFNCPNGCCLADGTCFAPTDSANGSDIPCGSNGEACVTCPSGDTCLAGGCMQFAEPCTPDTCKGCCLLGTSPAPGLTSMGSGCYVGSQDLYCGSGGAQCQACAPSMNGGHCAAGPASGGHCEGVGTCDATNCAGCCAGDLCVVGTQNVGCGSAGAECQDCASDGGLCLGFTTRDGGTDRFCAYDCLNTSPPPACNLYCTSATDCFSAADFPRSL